MTNLDRFRMRRRQLENEVNKLEEKIIEIKEEIKDIDKRIVCIVEENPNHKFERSND